MFPRPSLFVGIIVSAAALALPAHASAQNIPSGVSKSTQEERYFAQIGVGHLGSIRFDTDFVFINSGDPADFLLEFFVSTGDPLEVEIFRSNLKCDDSSSLRTMLSRGETLNLAIRSEGSLQAGYARLTTGSDVSGVIAFTRSELPAGRIQYQAGVPVAQVLQDFTIPVKFVPRVGDMGFAIVNPAPQQAAGPSGTDETARVVLRLYDESFRLHGITELTLPAGAHLARFVAELFPDIEALAGGNGFNGSMTVESSRPLAAISVLHTGVPTLTTVPVTPGRADQETAAPASFRVPSEGRK